MKKLYLSNLSFTVILTGILLVFTTIRLSAQTITNYTFAASSGTFTALTGATAPGFSAGNEDDAAYNALPIGFDFFYMGTRYTTVSASSNGFLVLGANVGDATTYGYINNLTTWNTPRPVLAPLWDDLAIQVAGNLSYLTSGTAPNRVFTVQWLNTQWDFNATGNTISFQVKLYEGTGKVDFVYRPESGAVNASSASIGITAIATTGSGSFLSLNNFTNAPTVSSTVETTTISAKPTSGQTYGWTPAVPTAPTSLSFTGITTTGMTLNWADNSSNETGFAIYRSTDGTNYTYITQTAAAATSSAQSGLTAATTYYWKVYAVTEGGLSTALSGTQATSCVAPNISQIPTSNLILNYKFTGNANDSYGSNNGTLQNAPTLTTNRFLIANNAYTFNGTSQYVSTSTLYTNPTNFSISIWFKTTTTTGGRLIGFGASQTGSSGSYDRQLYMNNAGQIYFGVYPGAVKTINSTAAYNDGNWHIATATLSTTTGIVLYMDGVQVAADATVVSAENYSGYWRIGYDNLTSWTSAPTSFYFNGTLDDVLIYQRSISSAEAITLYKSPDGAGNNGPLCWGSALNLTSTTVAGATYAWTGPNGFTSTAQNPTLTYSAAYAGVYTVNVTSSGCTSTAYTTVASTASSSTIAYSGSPFCTTGGTVSVTQTGTTGGTYSSTAGLSINAATGAVNLGLSTAGTYTVTYTVAGGCASSTSIIVSAVPTTSNAGADQTGIATCGLTTVTLAANTPTVGTGAWSIVSGAGGTVTTPTSATSTFSGTAGSTYTLRWTTTNGSCTTTDDVIISFNRTPTTSNAGADQTGATTCGLTTVTLAGNAPSVGTGAWSIVSGTGGTVTTPASATSTFSGTAGTTYTLRWTISNSPCTASTDDVVITFNRNPTTSAAGADQTGAATCGLTTVTLAANVPTVGTGAWSIVSGAGGTVTTPTSATSTFSGTAGTTYTLRWTISNSPCTASTDDVVVTFNRNPTTSAAGADQTGATTCGLTTVTLAGNAPSIGTGAWSIVSGTGGTVTTPTSATSTFSGTAGNTYTLRWTISNSPCTASTDDVVITFNQNPTTSNAGADQTGAATCGLTTVTLAANTPTAGTGSWSIISGTGGTVTIPTSATSTFSGTAGTTYTLRWSISNAPCTASTDDVVITFTQNPTTSNAGADQTGIATCGLTTVTLAANVPAVGTGAWSIVSGAGGTVTTPTSATSTFSGTAGNTYTLRWTISNSPCTASTDDVVITFNQNPTTSNAGADQTGAATCGLTTVTLAANTPTAGTGAWSIISGTGGTVTTPTSATSTFSGTAGTTYTLRWSISNAPCTASTDDVVITFTQNPTTSNAGADQTGATTCGLTTVTLAANTPTIGTAAWSIISGTGGTVTTPTSATSTFTGTAGTTYTLRWTISNSSCTASTDDVIIGFNLIQVIATSGTASGCYTTIKQAFDAINSGTHQGAITIKVNGSTTESAAAVLNASGTGSSSYTSINVYPTITGLTISGTLNTPLIDLSGADNVIIDGRVNATGTTRNLTIINSSTGTGASAIRFINSAESNTIKYCTIKGASLATAGGVVLFSTTAAGTGNINNSIDNCNLTGADDTNRPVNVIYSAGTSTRENTGCIISNNSIYDFIRSGGNSYGIDLRTFTSNWTISGNSFYETNTIDPTGSFTYRPIYISNASGTNFSIINNYIGGSAPLCGGAAWKTGLLSTASHILYGMEISVGTTAFSSVQNNVIKNFDVTSKSAKPWQGIRITDGNVNVGTVTGNIIGSATGNGSVKVTNDSLTTTSYGIFSNSTDTLNINNNTIGSITTVGSASISHDFMGISKTSGGTVTINNNLIGSLTTSNSIQASSASTAGGQTVTGISSLGLGSVTISGNTIANLYNAYLPATSTNGQMIGIDISGSGTYTVQNNIVRNLSTASPNTSNNASASVLGISDVSSGAGKRITGNTIFNLSNTSASAAVSLVGLYYSGSISGTNTISGNFVHSLTISSTSTSADIYGIKIGGGATTCANNIITIGAGLAGGYPIYGIYETGGASNNNNLYFNTVYIGGTTTGLSSLTYALYSNTNNNARDIRNNILNNARSTPGATDTHFALRVAGTTSLTLDFNNYFANGTGGTICRLGSTNYATIDAWITALSSIGADSNSIDKDPLFAAAGGTIAANYTSSQILNGVAGTGITTDYFGATRINLPKMGAIDCSFNADLLEVTAATRCGTGTVTLSATASAGAVVTWLDAPKNGNVLATGTSFTTPSLSTTTTYYVEAIYPGCRASLVSPVIATVTPTPAATISYTGSPFCTSSGTVAVNRAGTAGGTYSSTAGLSINASTGEITPNTSTAGTYTVTYTVTASGGCAQFTTTTNLTISTAPAASISYSASPFCVNSGTKTVTLTGTTGGTFSSQSGLDISASTGAINSANSIAGTYTVTYTVAASGGCPLYITNTAVVVGTAGLWTGAIDTVWTKAGNWSCSGVPTASSDLHIPAGLSTYPVITGTQALRDITVDEGASVTVLGHMKVSGSIYSSGTFDVSNGTIEFDGASLQTIPAGAFYNNKIKNLIISNTVSLLGQDSLTGTLTVAAGKTFITNDSLILKSTAAGTARVASLPVNGSGVATASITGKVSVERYLPMRNAWRLLSAPVDSAGAPSLNASWQEGVTTASPNPNPVPGYGVFVQGGSVANGFDQGLTSNPSVKIFNNASNSFQGLPATPGTSIPITKYPGYFVFVRGDRGINLQQGTSAAITRSTLRMKGKLLTGNVTSTVNATGYTVFGNPYPSAINFETLTRNNVKNGFYAWDPQLSGNFGLGGYVTASWDSIGGRYDFTASVSPVSEHIASGEAILVQSGDSLNPGTIVVKESDKTTEGSDAVFGRTNGFNQQVRVNLLSANANGTTTLIDGILTTYDDDHLNELTSQDAKKITSGSENIGIKRQGKMLAIERRKTITTSDTSFLNIYQMKLGNYKLAISTKNMNLSNTIAVLKDSYNSSVNNMQLDMNGTTSIPFTISSNPASYATGRFSIVFNPAAVLPVTFTHVRAYAQQKEVMVEWGTSNETNLQHYEVERSADAVNFTKIHTTAATSVNGAAAQYKVADAQPMDGSNYYRIKSVDVGGQEGFSKTVQVNMNLPVEAPYVSVFPNPVVGTTVSIKFGNVPKGDYQAQLFDALGQLVASKTIQYNGNNDLQSFELNEKFGAGKYELQVSCKGVKLTTSVMKR